MNRNTCFAGCFPAFHQHHKPKQETFEEVVAFLQQVPLLVNEFPLDDIPRLALALTTIGTSYFRPGSVLASQGALPDANTAFFLFYGGEALVVWEGYVNGEFTEVQRGVLSKCDYYGGRGVVENIPNNVTIMAGAHGVTVLTLSKSQFEEFGFPRINWPVRRITAKRYDNADDPQVGTWEDMTPEGVKFVQHHLGQNANLRSLLKDDVFEKLAKKARRLQIPSSTVIYNAGDPANELYVIESGHVLMEKAAITMGHQTSLKGIKRRLRKQAFLQQMVPGAAREESDPWSRQVSMESACAGSFQSLGSKSPSLQVASVALVPCPKAAHQAGGRKRSKGTTDAYNDQAFNCNGTLFIPGRHTSDLNIAPKLGRAASLDQPFTNAESEAGPLPTFGGGPHLFRTARSRSVCGVAAAKLRVNDCVTVKGGDDEVGRVVEVLPNEQVVVDFLAKGSFTYRAKHLKIAPNDASPTTSVGVGGVIGEISVLYNMPRMTCCKASPTENVVVYMISRTDLQKCMEGENDRNRDKIVEWTNLLGEVKILSSLVQVERMEMARHVTGEMMFQPHERIMQRGRMLELGQWYVISGGTAVIKRDESDIVGIVHRGGHFGDRSLLYNGGISDVHVDAGDHGVLCLCINGDVLKRLKVIYDAAGFTGSLDDFIVLQRKDLIGKQQSSREIDPRNLEFVEMLGHGSFANVTLVQDAGKNQQFALKQVSKRRVRQMGCQKMICNERDIMSLVDNKFIIKLHLSYQDRNFVYLLQEAALGSTLETVLDKYHAQKLHGYSAENKAWTKCVQYYAACISLGLKHLHDRHIAHRDLKPGNILLDTAGCPKIIDMGFARFVLDKTSTILGTPEYMAPEIIEFPNAHNVMVDYWALGVLIFELLNGEVPWDDDKAQGQHLLYRMRQLQKAEPQPSLPYDVSPAAGHFVRKLLVADPSRRMGAKGFDEIKEHHWFRENFFDFDSLDPQLSSDISLVAMQPPRCPVAIEREKDDEFAAKPGSFEADDVFSPIEEFKWTGHNVRIQGEQMTASCGHRNIEASAMCQSSGVVRLTVNWLPQSCKGPVHVGLTSNPNDSSDFSDGCRISIIPFISEPKRMDCSYWIPSGSHNSRPITLAIEDNAAVVYQGDIKVHTMNKKMFEPDSRIYAFVFMHDNGDSIAVSAYEEFSDDESNWTSAFKSIESLRRLPKSQSVASLSAWGLGSDTKHDKKGGPKDIPSLLAFLAAIEQRDGEEEVKAVVRAAFSAAEKVYAKPVPSLAKMRPTPCLDAGLADFESRRGRSPVRRKSPKMPTTQSLPPREWANEPVNVDQEDTEGDLRRSASKEGDFIRAMSGADKELTVGDLPGVRLCSKEITMGDMQKPKEIASMNMLLKTDKHLSSAEASEAVTIESNERTSCSLGSDARWFQSEAPSFASPQDREELSYNLGSEQRFFQSEAPSFASPQEREELRACLFELQSWETEQGDNTLLRNESSSTICTPPPMEPAVQVPSRSLPRWVTTRAGVHRHKTSAAV